MATQIAQEFVDLGNFTLTMVIRQPDGALWMSVNMDDCPIIQEFRNSRVQEGGI
jgi:hypothetical protein